MATPVMSSTMGARLLEVGLHEVFNKEYLDRPPQWQKVFKTEKSGKRYEDDQAIYGLGLAPALTEGANIEFDAGGSGWSQRYTHVSYALGVAISREAQDDNQYLDLGSFYSKDIARSLRNTYEVVAANILNNAFSDTATANPTDGVALCATNHTLKGSGATYSNELATPAALSETTLEDLLIQKDGWLDDRGQPMMVDCPLLVIPKDLQFEAARILRTDGRVATANNDLNAIKAMGLVPEVHIMHRLTSTTAHFLITNHPNGLKHFNRVSPEFATDVDFNTFNMKLKGYQRGSFGYTDAHGIIGNVGA